jgi:cyclophilin family peptidyl-prolyl cis-trans isomerase
MHPFMRSVWNSLQRGAAARKTSESRRARLSFEVLEDRCVPAGSISGLVYLNSISNGISGAVVNLTGTPSGSTPVDLDAVTAADGSFQFNGLPSGNYHLSTGPFTGLLGTVTIGGVSTSPDITIDGTATVTTGTTQKNFAIQGGLAPSFITMSLFLTSTEGIDFAFQAAPGAGAGNDAPVVAKSFTTQTLSSTATTKTINLAGHFSDPNITNSAITMNVTANGVANQHINLILSDTTTPQAVANFFDYINAGAYDNNFFFRNTNPAAPPGGQGIDILQAGGPSIIDGSRPTVNSTLFPTIPDEIAALNKKGTIAMANTGAANTSSSQFFFNVADNPGLDPAPGKQSYTVFGKVADAASQAVLDSLTAVPTVNLSGASTIVGVNGATQSGNTVTITTTGNHHLMAGQKVTISGVSNLSYNGLFTVLSVLSPTEFTYTNPTSGLASSGNGTVTPNGFLVDQVPLTGGAATDFPTDASRYLVINSITTTQRDDFLTYSVVSNSNATLVTPNLTNEQLVLTYGTGSGTADIVVKATDRFGGSTTATIHVVVANVAPAVTSAPITPDNAAAVTTLTANPTATDANGDTVTFTYQWLQNGVNIAGATSQTLNLNTVTVNEDDTFSVRVTPNDGKVNGTAFTSPVVTIDTTNPITLL